MLLGFSGHLAQLSHSAPPLNSRFSVQGRHASICFPVQRQQLEFCYVFGGSGAPNYSSDSVFLCGYVNNYSQILSMLRERGMSVPFNPSVGDCIRLIYEAYGVHGFNFLEGLFVAAFVSNNHLILCASKTPGPSLYYQDVASQSQGFFFGTELKAFPREMRRLRPFEDIQADDGPQRMENTCLVDVRRIPAGHVLEIEMSSAEVKFKKVAYYSVLRNFSLTNEKEAAQELASTLKKSINDLPGQTANCLISGGLDSSIVALLAKDRYRHLNLFSLGTTTRNEFDKAQLLANYLRLPISLLVIEENDFLSALSSVVALTEHCFSIFIEYLIPVNLAHKAIREPADILLSGYGADVLFGGFARPNYSLCAVTELVHTEYESTVWSNEASQTLGGASGFSVGYPFYDSRVVDLAFCIDPYLKHKNGVEKYILRRAFAGRLPDKTIQARKVGIHQGTGCEEYFSARVGERNNQKAVRCAKDLVCYKILRELLVNDADPVTIDAQHIFEGV